MLRKKRLDIVAQLQVYVYVNSTPIFTYIIYMYTDVESSCAINAPAQLWIYDCCCIFLWRVNSAGHICTVSGNLQSSPPQPRNWGGTKARLALWINPSLGLETPLAMFHGQGEQTYSWIKDILCMKHMYVYMYINNTCIYSKCVYINEKIHIMHRPGIHWHH